jgi:hypothetical protein
MNQTLRKTLAGWKRHVEDIKAIRQPGFQVGPHGDEMRTPYFAMLAFALASVPVSAGAMDPQDAAVAAAKPVPPPVPKAPFPDPALCAQPGALAKLKDVMDESPGSMPHYSRAYSKYREAVVEWKADRLTGSGKVTKQRLSELVLAGLKAGSPDGDMGAGFAHISGMFAVVEEVAKKEKQGDEPGACRALFKMFTMLERGVEIANRQWDAMEAALDAEAARVGVSFD